jgi:hypothetical protein
LLSKKADWKPPQLIDMVDEIEGGEVICGDMCNNPAINWGRGNKILSN